MALRRDGYDRIVLFQDGSGMVVDVCKALWQATPTQVDDFFTAASGSMFRRTRTNDFRATAVDPEELKWLRAMAADGRKVRMCAIGNCTHENWQSATRLNVADHRGGARNFAGLTFNLTSSVFDPAVFQSANLLEGFPWRGSLAALHSDGTYMLKGLDGKSWQGPGWVGAAGDEIEPDGTMNTAGSVSVRMVLPISTAKLKLSNCTGTVTLLGSDETIISTVANDVEITVTAGTWFVDVVVSAATDDPVLEITDTGTCQGGREISQPVTELAPPQESLFVWYEGNYELVRDPALVEHSAIDTLYDRTTNGYDGASAGNDGRFETKKTSGGVDVDPVANVEFGFSGLSRFTLPAAVAAILNDSSVPWSLYLVLQCGGDYWSQEATQHNIITFGNPALGNLNWTGNASKYAADIRFTPVNSGSEATVRYGERCIISITCDGADNFLMRVNGTLLPGGSATWAGDADLWIGGAASAGTDFKGKIFEVLGYSAQHNAGQILAVETYLEQHNISPVTRVQGSQIVYSDTAYIHSTANCPVQLRYHSAAYLPEDGLCHIVGGEEGPVASAVLVATHRTYDPITKVWGTLAVLPSARKEGRMEAVNGKLYYIGGDGGSGATNTVYEYDPVGNTWATKATMTGVRRLHQTCTRLDHIFVVGGYDLAGTARCEVYRYNTATNVWDSNASWNLATHGNVQGQWVVSGIRGYLLGGERNTISCGSGAMIDSNQHQSIDLTDLASGWTTEAAGAVSSRDWTMGLGRGDNVYHCFGFRNDVQWHDVDTMTLGTPSVAAQVTGSNTHFEAASCVVNGGLYIFGGTDDGSGGRETIFETICFVPPEGMDL